MVLFFVSGVAGRDCDTSISANTASVFWGTSSPVSERGRLLCGISASGVGDLERLILNRSAKLFFLLGGAPCPCCRVRVAKGFLNDSHRFGLLEGSFVVSILLASL